MKPLLKWVGGKKFLVSDLRTLWTDNGKGRIVEPFVGGASVSLGINPPLALLNDVNPYLINFYRHVASGTFKPDTNMVNSEDFYLARREEFNELVGKGDKHSLRLAQLFYYLNKTCFNGVCRFNKSGKFNVPFGHRTGLEWPEELETYQAYLENWDFYCEDFSALKLRPKDFLYCDPPYFETFTNYSSEGFSWEDQVRLADWAAKHVGPTIISNSWKPEILELYASKGFVLQKIRAPRVISADGEGRDPVSEVLAYRNAKFNSWKVQTGTDKGSLGIFDEG